MLKIIVIKIDENFPFEKYLHWFNSQSQNKINNYHFKVDKVRAFVSEIFKYYYLAKFIGFNPKDTQIKHNKFGKPYLQLQDGKHIDFSVSHSGEYVTMAIYYDDTSTCSKINIGIDIEKIDEKIKPQELAKLVFSPCERNIMGDDVDKFFMLWTKKEALFKAHGTGFINDYYMSTKLTTNVVESANDYIIYASKFMSDYYISCCVTKSS